MAVRIARQQEDSESEIVLVPLGARGGPESRMLCPACPADASVAKGTLFNRMFGRDYSYCCPGAPVWAITRTRTATQTQTMTAGGGGGGSAGGGSTGKAVHRGQAWYDNNNDKKYTPGADKLVANQWVILWLPNGQILGRAKTDSKGAYSMQSKVYKSTKLSISLLKAPTQPIMSFWTGKNGNSRVVMPVPPPRISGRVYRKTTRKVAGRAKNEVVGKPLANSFVLIKFAVNGTLWKRVPTDSQGRYNWAYSGTTGKRYPFLQILILSPDSKIMKASRLDGNGNGAIKDVVLPPATKVKVRLRSARVIKWAITHHSVSASY